MFIAPSNVSSLSASLARWEIAEYVSAAFVTLACAGEGIADFTKWFTGGIKQRKERLAKISTLLLIVSLSVELICLVKTNSLSGMLIGSLADKAETAKTSAETAIKDSSTAVMQAKDALDKADKAQRSLGQAEDKANKAQSGASNALTLARGAREEADSFEKEIKSAKEIAAETKEKLADRTLSDEQVRRIASKLAGFSGQEYTVTAYWDSKESLGIANRVHTALQTARWSYFDEGSKSMMLGGTIGIFVYVHPDADENTKEASEALVKALQSEGLEALLKMQNPQNNPKHNKMSINVGSKR